MTRIGADHAPSRARKRKALLASGAVLGIGASVTLAGWSDDSWVSGLFNTETPTAGDTFTIQTALAPDAFVEQIEHTLQTDQNDRYDDSAARMLQRSAEQNATFTPAVTLTPGQTTYLPLYVRTSPDTESDAIVSVSQAQNGRTGDSYAHTPLAIWGAPDAPGYATYGARVQPLDDPASPPECAAEYFDGNSTEATDLIGGTTAAPAADAANAPAPAAGLVPMTAAAPTTRFALEGEAGNTYMVCFRFHLDPRAITESPELNGAPFQPSWTFTGEAMDQ